MTPTSGAVACGVSIASADYAPASTVNCEDSVTSERHPGDKTQELYDDVGCCLQYQALASPVTATATQPRYQLAQFVRSVTVSKWTLWRERPTVESRRLWAHQL